MFVRSLSYPAGAAGAKAPSAPPLRPTHIAAVHSSHRPVPASRQSSSGSTSSNARGSNWGAAYSTGRASRRASVKVQANWGAPVEFQPAKVVSNSPAASGPLHKLVIDVGSLAAGYTIPGQFMQIKLEFLIKGAPGSTADLLCSASAGSEVHVSPVMGKGFPLDRLPPSATTAVLMFATGSGISPIRAILESGALKGRDVTLYYGTRSPESTAYKELVPAWEAAGVKVVQVFSESKQGYVHDVFEREGLSRLPADAAASVGAVLCGHKGMCQAVTTLLTAKGVPPERILLNF